MSTRGIRHEFVKRADELGVPVIPPLPKIPGKFRGPNPVIAVCGECGLELHEVMGYVCMRSNCPSGLGSARSK